MVSFPNITSVLRSSPTRRREAGTDPVSNRKGVVQIRRHVPGSGCRKRKGNFIEIAEKSILWFKVTVNGKQGHASRPRTTENALRKGAQLITEIDETLHRKYPDRDELFDEPLSTFEPTRTEKLWTT